MIQLKNVKKQFNNRLVLDTISFSVPKGEITALLGANGAGKSTIIRLISTIYKQDEGEIIIDGLNTLKEPEKVRKKIGVLLGGDVYLYNSLTARENIQYFAELQGIEKDEIKNKIEELVKVFQMEEYIDTRVEKFSRGMKQKVAFARAIIHSPDILILDEPSTGLDIEAIMMVRSFIKECQKEGRTILLSTHNMNEIELCDNYVFLKEGKIKAQGKKFDTKDEAMLRKLFSH